MQPGTCSEAGGCPEHGLRQNLPPSAQGDSGESGGPTPAAHMLGKDASRCCDPGRSEVAGLAAGAAKLPTYLGPKPQRRGSGGLSHGTVLTADDLSKTSEVTG